MQSSLPYSNRRHQRSVNTSKSTNCCCPRCSHLQSHLRYVPVTCSHVSTGSASTRQAPNDQPLAQSGSMQPQAVQQPPTEVQDCRTHQPVLLEGSMQESAVGATLQLRQCLGCQCDYPFCEPLAGTGDQTLPSVGSQYHRPLVNPSPGHTWKV